MRRLKDKLIKLLGGYTEQDWDFCWEIARCNWEMWCRATKATDLLADELAKRKTEETQMNLNEWAKEIHRNAVEHGWWEEDRGFGEIVALCHSELSEALEEHRDGHPMAWDRCMKNPNPNDKNCDLCPFDNDDTCDVRVAELKPEGVAVEMIDCMIRILDWCGKEQIDVDKLLRRKHEYNKTRPYRHGGKKL